MNIYTSRDTLLTPFFQMTSNAHTMSVFFFFDLISVSKNILVEWLVPLPLYIIR